MLMIALCLFSHQVHNLFFDGNVLYLLSLSSCVLFLAQAQAVYQVQKEEALKLIWQKHTHSKPGEKSIGLFL